MAPDELSRKHMEVVHDGMNPSALVPKHEDAAGAGDGSELLEPVSSTSPVPGAVRRLQAPVGHRGASVGGL